MSVGRAALRALVLVALLLSGARAASAQEAPGPVRIALLATTPDDPLAGRIEAELRALRFEVERAAIPADVPIDEVVRQKLAGGARAAVIADGHRTDVWIAASGADRVGLRQELEVDEDSGLQSVLALRTVEFLRISLGLAAQPPVAPIASPPAAVQPPPAVARGVGLALDVSSGVLADVRGLRPFVVVGASLRARLGRLFGFELCGYAPLTNSDVGTDPSAGQAHTSIWLAGGGLVLGGARPDRRFSGEAGAGALAVVARAVGVTAGPAVGSTVEGVGAALYGRAAGQLQLGRAWALRLDVLAGGALARPTIVIGDRDAAHWGRVFVAALGGGEIRF